MHIRKIAVLIFVLMTALVMAGDGPYEASWESLQKHQNPEWFRDAKFGIYFHWGVYSVPAYANEWYPHWMYVPGKHWGDEYFEHHKSTWGDQKEFGYKDFIPIFTAENFDPDAWAELFKKSGARFAGPVGEHADGFAMWNSGVNRWNAAQMGPRRDVVGEMEKAIRRQGLKFMVSFHHQWLWGWYPTWDDRFDCSNPEYADFYGPVLSGFSANKGKLNPMPHADFCQNWFDKIKEVIDAYQPDLLWFDSRSGTIQESTRTKFLSYYYNQAVRWERDVTITYKNKDFEKGTGIVDLERGRMDHLTDYPWLNDDSIDWNTWCNVQDPNYKPTNRLIDGLVDIVSKNGALLLNITPTAKGEIPPGVQERLLNMGEWLELNGEAVYGTRPWKVFGEGPTKVTPGHFNERKIGDFTSEDIRFTTRYKVLYAIVLDWPEAPLQIKSLGMDAGNLEQPVQSIELIGSEIPLKWEQRGSCLEVEFPDEKPCSHAYVLKIE